MANIKSAKKRILVNNTKMEPATRLSNPSVKTAIKKVDAAVVAKDAEAAKACSPECNFYHRVKLLPRVFITRTHAARKVSRLTKAVNGIQ